MTDTLPRKKRKRVRTPQWVRRPGRVLSGSQWFAPVAAFLAIQYLKLTFHTNKWVVEPADALDKVAPHLPVIAAVWHGQHILLPVIPVGIKGSVMISRSLDGEITARIAHAFGAKAIRASGGRDRSQALQKGGISGFLEMLRALERGESVMQTADIPKGTPRRAGQGIIALAKRSGRPIIPLAVASSRRKVVKGAWDRTTFNLPFGRSAIVMGEPVMIAADADDAALEAGRLALQAEMDRATARAYELTGNPEK
ncbi:MAG TPA: lysophospholipid acyltransferase family protein [Rhizobiaceae bacterium]|nr:lysophospholipid acyltransferase family protein [Rhizobiaceae bacterium]